MLGDVNEGSDAEKGKQSILWAYNEMPVLKIIRERFKKEKPLMGIKIAGCLHITTETANLAITLKEGGAEVAMCASNPLSTQDEVAHSLIKDYGISIFAIHGEDDETYYKHIHQTLDFGPHITMDDGGDLVSTLHKDRESLLSLVVAGTEETTTGVHRLNSMEKAGALRYPVIAVNNAYTKHLFDNRYGTGQSTIDGIIRATNILLAGKQFVVAGYGWCGRGVAMRARGMGAHVTVTEVDPIRALEAIMDGFSVSTMDWVVESGDIFVTTTGNTSVICRKHFQSMKDGAIVANSGHFNVEIDVESLKSMSIQRIDVRQNVEEFTLRTLRGGKKIYLLSNGRLVNLSAAEGHPASVMDMSFANQSLCAEYIVENKGNLDVGVHNVPEELDRRVAELKLSTMGIKIDELTEEQEKYMNEWRVGT
jgi:adenosylhomocysteinase|tara:strand:+ start:17512 stop:18777 length:1266 start_codon:yes stop_codon:yes gene_type:complete